MATYPGFLELDGAGTAQPPYIQAPAGGIVIRPRSNRIPLAALFAVLWSGGMLWRSPSIDLHTVIMAVIAGAIVGGLMYWLFDKFSARP
jgi:membrane protein DedA with SNARE-associated domain